MKTQVLDVFLLSSSGTQFCKIDDKFYHLNLGYMPGLPQSGRVVCLNETAWSNFWNEIEQLNVWSWNATNLEVAFPEREGAAGCGVPNLYFVCAADNKCTLLQASNRFPPKWGNLNTLLMELFNSNNVVALTQDEINATLERMRVFDKAIQELCESMELSKNELLSQNNADLYQDLLCAINNQM